MSTPIEQLMDYWGFTREEGLALALGHSYEYEPETAEYGDDLFIPVEDRWYHALVETGLKITPEGKVFVTEHQFYDCGDVEVEEHEVATPEDMRKVHETIGEDCEDSVKAYLEWVAETGKDPYRWVRGHETKTIIQRWEANLRSTIVGPTVVRARLEGGEWVSPNCLPEDVLLFLAAEKRGDRWIVGVRDKEMTWQEVREAPELTWIDNNHATFEIASRVTVALGQEEIKALAREALEKC